MLGPDQIVAFQQDRQHRAADREERHVHRRSRNARGARGRRRRFTDSLLASAPVVSQPHPERKSVLIEANALLLTDIPGADAVLERHLPPVVLVRRAQLGFDARKNSRTTEIVTFAVTAHYALSRVVAAAGAHARRAAADAAAVRRCPTSAACSSASTTASRSCRTSRCGRARADDARRLFLDRRARFHVRHAVHGRASTTSTAGGSRRRTRPRRCPSRSSRSCSGSTATSPSATGPRCAPASSNGTRRSSGSASRTRSVVEMQPDDADWDAVDVRHASVRWMTDGAPELRRHRPVDRRSAHRRDPRRGHRLSTRDCAAQRPHFIASSGIRRRRARRLPARVDAAWPATTRTVGAQRDGLCARPARGARRRSSPTAPKPRSSSNAFLKDVVMHEVGHTLGLTHNFRASTDLHASAARRSRVHPRRTASPAR